VNRTWWVATAVIVLAIVFAVEGGEYSTRDWLTLRRAEREEQQAIAVLRTTVDSLAKVEVAVERDPAVQERVAREHFGMIRKGEFLYRLVQPRDEPGPGSK
jgi:cell division protein FtsB